MAGLQGHDHIHALHLVPVQATQTPNAEVNDTQMAGAAIIAVALALAASTVLFLYLRLTLRLYRDVRQELDNEKKAHNVTRDRLLASHKEGFLIPPAPPPEQAVEEFWVPESLAPIWEQWESDSSQKKTKEIVRGQYQSGRSVKSILDEWGFGQPQPEQE